MNTAGVSMSTHIHNYMVMTWALHCLVFYALENYVYHTISALLMCVLFFHLPTQGDTMTFYDCISKRGEIIWRICEEGDIRII